MRWQKEEKLLSQGRRKNTIGRNHEELKNLGTLSTNIILSFIKGITILETKLFRL